MDRKLVVPVPFPTALLTMLRIGWPNGVWTAQPRRADRGWRIA